MTRSFVEYDGVYREDTGSTLISVYEKGNVEFGTFVRYSIIKLSYRRIATMKKFTMWSVVVLLCVMSTSCGLSQASKVDKQISELLESSDVSWELFEPVMISYKGLSDDEKAKIKNYADYEKYWTLLISNDIETAFSDEVLTTEEYNSIVEKYGELPDSATDLVTGYEKIEKYHGVDIDTLNEFNKKIQDVDDKTPFSDVLEYFAEYDSMDSSTKELINITKIQTAMEMNDLEKAAVEACSNLRSAMKSKGDFRLQSVTVKDDTEKMNFYWVLIKYSGTNSFGGTIDDISCFGITPEFEDPFWGLSQITGKTSTYIKSTTSYLEYVKSAQPEVDIDVDKIMYYIE